MGNTIQLANYLAELILSQFEERMPEAVPEQLDVYNILYVASMNQIAGFVERALMLRDEISEELHNELKQDSFLQIIKSKKQEAEIKKIQDVFEKEKIKNMPMKGVFMKKYYPLAELREMGDIDLVVEEKDLKRAGEVLQNIGYRLVERVSNHDVYEKDKVFIEVHKSMYKQEIDKKQHEYFESFAKVERDKGKNYCYHQSLEDFYVYMIAHMAGHFYIKGCGVRNLIDIYVFWKLFKCKVDEQYIQKELKECGINVFEQHMRKMSQIWLCKEASDDFYDDLICFMVNCGIYGKAKYGIWNEYANETKNASDKNRMKLWYAFPPLHYMRKYYRYLKKYPFLLPFSWIHRIVRGFLFKRGKERRDYLNEVPKQEIESIQNIYRKMKFEFD